MPSENVTLVANFAEACFTPNYTQNFTGLSSLPPKWTQTGTPTWAVGTIATVGLAAGQGNYAYANYSGTAAQAGQMVSDCFDFGLYSDISISMHHRFYSANSGNSAFLEYSINGGTWTQIANWTTSMGAGATYSSGIIPALAGQNNVKFRWRVVYPSHGNPSRQKTWSVDDITITGTFIGGTITPGDVNDDGFVNVLDVVWMVSHLNGSTPAGFNMTNADVNGDSSVNIADLTALINLILGGAKNTPLTNEDSEAYIFLDKDGLVKLESDGNLIAILFQLSSAQSCNANISLLIDTDHTISYNKDSGIGVIYSMNNTPIPAGEISLFKITDIAISTINWGLTQASTEGHTLVEIKSSTAFDATPISEILGEFDINIYPNPTAGRYSIRLVLPEDAFVDFKLITRSGGILKQTENTLFGQGEHILEFTADSTIRSGMYFIIINVSDTKTRRLIRTIDEKIIIMR